MQINNYKSSHVCVHGLWCLCVRLQEVESDQELPTVDLGWLEEKQEEEQAAKERLQQVVLYVTQLQYIIYP